MPSARYFVDKFNVEKTLPHVAIRISTLVNSDAATMQDFEEIIKLDPILVARLLRLVNSPYFGLHNKVESIAKAVVFIGIKHLRNLVTVESLRNFFKEKGDDSLFSRKNLWFHSATVAILSQMISRRIFGQDGEDVFLAGIIHDIGLIVEDQLASEELIKVCSMYQKGGRVISDIENEILGTNHSKIGKLLASEWQLPEEVVEAVRLHHYSDKIYPIPSIISILQLAEFMAGKLKYSILAGYSDPLPDYLKSHLKSQMAQYKVLLKALPGEMEKARELYGADEGQ